MNNERRSGSGFGTLNLIAAGALVGTLTVAVPGVRDVFRFGDESNPDGGMELADSSATPDPISTETTPVELSPSASPSVTELPTISPSLPAASETVIATAIPSTEETAVPTETATEVAPIQDEFGAGAFNMLYSTVPGSEWSAKWPYRLGLSIRLIRKYLDVAALQEIRPEVLLEMQNNKIQTSNGEFDLLGDDFGVFPKSDIGYGSQNPVVWRKSEFEFVEGKLVAGPHVTKPGIYPDSATLVKLQHKTTKRFVYVLSEHAPVGAERAEPRHINAEARAQYLRQLQLEHPDALIMYGGDLNSYYNAKPGDPQPTKDNDPQKTAYCYVTNAGFIDALDAYEHRNDESMPKNCDPRDVHRVDHLFFTNEDWVRVKWYQYGGGENGELNAPGNGSDVHHTLVSTVKLTGPTNQ